MWASWALVTPATASTARISPCWPIPAPTSRLNWSPTPPATPRPAWTTCSGAPLWWPPATAASISSPVSRSCGPWVITIRASWASTAPITPPSSPRWSPTTWPTPMASGL